MSDDESGQVTPFGRWFARDLADQTSASRGPSADPVADHSMVTRRLW